MAPAVDHIHPRPGFCHKAPMIGGGHNEPLGIGHIFSVEMYDPATHSFRGFGCFDRKRCFATGLETDSGKVLIVGNWYNDDGMELFDGQKYFTQAGLHRLLSSAPSCRLVSV